jgi:hypothetical protein
VSLLRTPVIAAHRTKSRCATTYALKSFTQSKLIFKKTHQKYRFENKKLKVFFSTNFSPKKKRKIFYGQVKTPRIIKLRSGNSNLYPTRKRPVDLQRKPHENL